MENEEKKPNVSQGTEQTQEIEMQTIGKNRLFLFFSLSITNFRSDFKHVNSQL